MHKSQSQMLDVLNSAVEHHVSVKELKENVSQSQFNTKHTFNSP